MKVKVRAREPVPAIFVPKVQDIAPTSFQVSTHFFNLENEVDDVCKYLDFYWLSSWSPA